VSALRAVCKHARAHCARAHPHTRILPLLLCTGSPSPLVQVCADSREGLSLLRGLADGVRRLEDRLDLLAAAGPAAAPTGSHPVGAAERAGVAPPRAGGGRPHRGAAHAAGRKAGRRSPSAGDSGRRTSAGRGGTAGGSAASGLEGALRAPDARPSPPGSTASSDGEQQGDWKAAAANGDPPAQALALADESAGDGGGTEGSVGAGGRLGLEGLDAKLAGLDRKIERIAGVVGARTGSGVSAAAE
jgi:hypothetical protein